MGNKNVPTRWDRVGLPISKNHHWECTHDHSCDRRTCQSNLHSRQSAVFATVKRAQLITAVTHAWLSGVGSEIIHQNSQYWCVRHSFCRQAYETLWGRQSTSGFRIFGVWEPIPGLKTPKTSTSASTVWSRGSSSKLWKYGADDRADDWWLVLFDY